MRHVGHVESTPLVAEVEGAARMLTLAGRSTTGPIAVYTSSVVERYVTGQIVARKPRLSQAVGCLVAAAQSTTGVVWMPHDTSSSTYQLVMSRAQTHYAKVS